MEDFFSGLIPLFIIISIVFSIVSKAKQSQSKSSKSHPMAGAQKSAGQSLQDIIRQQIDEQKKAAIGAQTQSVKSTPKPEPVTFGEGNYVNKDSLENRPTEMQRHSHNVHGGEAYNEGDRLNRTTLEGTPVEMQRYSQKNHRGTSYNEGDTLNRYTLEGSPIMDDSDQYNLDVEAKASKIGTRGVKRGQTYSLDKPKVSLKFNGQGIVNGILMAEILGKRGGRRATR